MGTDDGMVMAGEDGSQQGNGVGGRLKPRVVEFEGCDDFIPHQTSNVERLAELASDLTSPKVVEKKKRSVRFDTTYLPPECNLDKVERATLYHNGTTCKIFRTRRKPGQVGYQILTPKSERESIKIRMEQPFKLVLTQADDVEFTFTGAENTVNEDSDCPEHIVSLTPIKKEQMLRLRMDLVFDAGGSNLSALLLSGGKKPPATALMRLHGLTAAQHTSHSVKPLLFFFLNIVAIVCCGFVLKPPADNLYARYRVSREDGLIGISKDIVARSAIIKQEFGNPVFDGTTLLDYHVDLYSAERVSFMMPFRSAGTRQQRGRTEEWELEGTSENDDEISVKFDGGFNFGEVAVEAIKPQETGNWQISSVKVDLYKSAKNYADTVLEWLVEWALFSFGSNTLSIKIEDRPRQQHLRVNIDIGHDGDKDGDADEGANTIIQEKSQLIEDKRVIGYIRPDDDHETTTARG